MSEFYSMNRKRKEIDILSTTRWIPIHAGKGRSVGHAIEKVIDYVKNPEKTDSGRLITSYECDSRTAGAEFLLSKREYLQNTGRERGKDDVIAYHLRQSFVPGEITANEANRLGYELAMRFTKGKHAFIVCSHTDKHHIHNHIIINSNSLDCTRKFRDFKGSVRAMKRLNDTICAENGYSIVEHPKRKGKTYDTWLGDRKKPSFREQIRSAIDAALEKKPKTYAEFLEMLRQAGYEIRETGQPAIRAKDQKRFVRMDSFGDEYAEEVLKAVIAGARKHQPRKKGAAEMSLLIDVQAKLAEGKSFGYANWASRYNINQMARALSFLKEHGLMRYEDLQRRTEEATKRYGDLSEKIKAAERRMEEIKDLKTQIINYAQTRDVYEAYRKAGYSKKFYREHEADILMHKAAKKQFDEMGIKKLPTVKSLSAEYAELLTEKKKAYSEYREARDEMKELLLVKANIDTIMGKDGKAHDEPQQKKPNRQ